jgi:seryl-tRNA synthetase
MALCAAFSKRGARVEPQDVETIIRHLATAIAKQDTINDDLRACLLEQREFNARQVAFNARQVEINTDLKTTLARIETLLARMIPHGENGRDA